MDMSAYNVGNPTHDGNGVAAAVSSRGDAAIPEHTTFREDVWRDKYNYIQESIHTAPLRLNDEFSRIEINYIDDDYFSDDLSSMGKTIACFNGGDISVTLIDILSGFNQVIPHGSVLFQLGNNTSIGSLSNCFVIGRPEDSYGGICKKDQELVQLMKRRGGVGIDISSLRPLNAEVSNSAKTSTGAVSFMNRFSNSTREVAQNGRRGALMLSMDIKHPDIIEFIKSKRDLTKITGANISVLIRDDFMEAVKDQGSYSHIYPINSEFSSDTYNPHLKILNAADTYREIIKSAHMSAEPGQIFVDRHWNYSPDGVYEQYRGVTTNPCSEIFMQEYDACRLMSINISNLVKSPYTDDSHIDFEELYRLCYWQQRLADDLVDLELECISRILNKIKSDDEGADTKTTEINLWENIYSVASKGRRTGCGITGLGDMLAKLGLKYDSDEAIGTVEVVMKAKMRAELDCTIDLAMTRGHFEGWDSNLEYDENGGKNEFYDMLLKEFPRQVNRMKKYGRRNVSWSCVAPTGSISIISECTSGMEPLFLPYYKRRRKIHSFVQYSSTHFVDDDGDKWTETTMFHPEFYKWYNMRYTMDINSLSPKELDEVFSQSPWFGSTAEEIDWKKRVEMQSCIQKYTSHSISSTINLPEDTTEETIGNIYMYAYNKGLKGITVYRDNCRSGVLVKSSNEFDSKDAVKRPKSLPCDIHRVVAKGKSWTVIVGKMNNSPYEVFAISGHDIKESSGVLNKVRRGLYNIVTEDNQFENITGAMSDEEEVITRLISTCLRHGANIVFVIEQLDKSYGDITSFSKAISRTLKKYMDLDKIKDRIKCESCNSTNLVMEEGCMSCKNCGTSKCG